MRPDSEAPRPEDPRRSSPPGARSSASAGASSAAGSSLRWTLIFAVLLVLGGLLANRVGPGSTPWSADALVPESERPDPSRPSLWLRARGEGDQSSTLRAAATEVARALPEERIPLGPPPGEVQAWLDAHALYLLPVDEHPKLAERLEDDAMVRAVQALRAELSSPAFGLTGRDARRDPLAIRELLTDYLDTRGSSWPSGASLSATGDILAADGRNLLIGLRVDGGPTEAGESADGAAAVGADELRTSFDPTSLERLEAKAREIVDAGGFEIDVELVPASGPVRSATASPADPSDPETSAATARRVGLGVLAAVCLVGFLWRRRARIVLVTAALAALATVAGAWASGWLQAGAFDAGAPPFALALALSTFVLMCALAHAWIESEAPPSAASSVMVGLLGFGVAVLPYPGLAPFAGAWAVACGVMTLGGGLWRLRFAGSTRPAELARPAAGWRRPLSQTLLASGAVCVVYLGMELPVRGVGLLGDAARTESFAAQFYDPELLVETYHPGADAPGALERAAEDQQALTALGVEEVSKISGPGSYLLAPSRLAARREGLAELRLRARMQRLRDLLEGQGFRSDAFTEFLVGAADIHDAPDANAALDGNMGPWIRSRLHRSLPPGLDLPAATDAEPAATVWVRTSVWLREARLPPRLEGADGRRIELHGPALARADDASRTRERLGLVAAITLWLIALASWLRSRDLRRALLVALAAPMTGGVVLGVLAFEGVAYDATALLPLLLLMSFAAFEAERAQASTGARSALGRAVLVASAGAVMAAQSDPWLHLWGMCLLTGGAIAGFVAFALVAPLVPPLLPPTVEPVFVGGLSPATAGGADFDRRPRPEPRETPPTSQPAVPDDGSPPEDATDRDAEDAPSSSSEELDGDDTEPTT